MRVLDKKIEVNKTSFKPELIVTIAFPLEIAKDESECISSEEFLEQFNKAIEEHEYNIEGLS